jgi:DNA-binding transcriptional MerR regulator
MPEFASLDALAGSVNDWCAEHGITPANGQAGEAVTERNIRFYRASGLLDAPGNPQGGPGYGEKHFLQLTAIRLLQAQGLPLRRIRELLYGRSIPDLREVQRRGLAAVHAVALPRAAQMPDELWRTIALDDEFLLISRRGSAVTPEQKEAILRILREPLSTHRKPATNKKKGPA